MAESRSCPLGFITLDRKQTGAPSAGNPHAGCDVAGAGAGFTVGILRHSRGNGSNKLGLTFGIPRQSSTLPYRKGVANQADLESRHTRREAWMRSVDKGIGGLGIELRKT